MSDGFYKRYGDTLLYAPNKVENANYVLTREVGADTPPTDGWQWFDSKEDAYAFHDLPLPLDNEPAPN